jgi:hypothetical protein
MEAAGRPGASWRCSMVVATNTRYYLSRNGDHFARFASATSAPSDMSLRGRAGKCVGKRISAPNPRISSRLVKGRLLKSSGRCNETLRRSAGLISTEIVTVWRALLMRQLRFEISLRKSIAPLNTRENVKTGNGAGYAFTLVLRRKRGFQVEAKLSLCLIGRLDKKIGRGIVKRFSKSLY